MYKEKTYLITPINKWIKWIFNSNNDIKLYLWWYNLNKIKRRPMKGVDLIWFNFKI